MWYYCLYNYTRLYCTTVKIKWLKKTNKACVWRDSTQIHPHISFHLYIQHIHIHLHINIHIHQSIYINSSSIENPKFVATCITTYIRHPYPSSIFINIGARNQMFSNWKISNAKSCGNSNFWWIMQRWILRNQK